MFLRHHISAAMLMMKDHDYREDIVSWFTKMITRTVTDTSAMTEGMGAGA